MSASPATFEAPLDAAAVKAAVSGALGREIRVFAEIDSTNDEARRLAQQGAPHGLVLVADFQRSGRGRRGAQWISPPCRNLLCSVLLRPSWPMQHWPRLTHAAALAIRHALAQAGLTPQLKWPNDVYVEGRKIAGILLEAGSGGLGAFIVIGFGLNVNLTTEDLPQELRSQATSVCIETGSPHPREPLLASILGHLEILAEGAEAHFPSILDQVRRCSLLLGREVTLESNGALRRGRIVDFSPAGGLLLESPAGVVEEIVSADGVRLAK